MAAECNHGLRGVQEKTRRLLIDPFSADEASDLFRLSRLPPPVSLRTLNFIQHQGTVA